MRRVATAAAATAMLMLPSCTRNAEVIEPKPEPSKATSTSASAVPEEPELPDQALNSTDEGAASFAYHWIRLFNFAAITGDIRELREVSSGCDPCLDYVSKLAAVPTSERPASAPWEVKSTRVHRDEKAADVRFEIETPDGSTEDLAFELSPLAPYEIRDLYVVEGR
jgi:hypothetical protein